MKSINSNKAKAEIALLINQIECCYILQATDCDRAEQRKQEATQTLGKEYGIYLACYKAKGE